MARLIEAHPDFAKCPYYEDFFLYTKAAHQQNETTKFSFSIDHHRQTPHEQASCQLFVIKSYFSA
eukprot:2765782-Karenia_brevis.AAC.1